MLKQCCDDQISLSSTPPCFLHLSSPPFSSHPLPTTSDNSHPAEDACCLRLPICFFTVEDVIKKDNFLKEAMSYA